MGRSVGGAAVSAVGSAILVGLVALANAPAGAQEALSSPAASAERVAAPGEELRADTPRSAVGGFLGATDAADYERAASYLNLRGLPAAQRKRAAELARQLRAVLDRALVVDPGQLSDDFEGDLTDGLAPRLELIGTIATSKGPVDLLLERVTRPDGTATWQFAARTVAQIPTLYEEFAPSAIERLLPPVLVDTRVLGVQLWHWIAAVVLVALAALIASLVTIIAARLGRAALARSRMRLDPALVDLTVGPLRLIVAVVVLTAGTQALALPVPLHRFAVGVEKGLAIVAVTWLLLRAIDGLARVVRRRFIERRKLAAAAMVPLGRRTLKVALGALALVATLQNVGFNVTGLLTALGIGGVAIALAAQKTIENLFGGVALIADQPVRVGDVCRFGDRIGTVEDIGLRSTRVRTAERTVISIPNAQFSSMPLESFRQRERILLRLTVGLHYETTPEQLRRVRTGVETMLHVHPKLHPEGAHVRVAEIGRAAIDLEIVAYVATTDGEVAAAVREEIYLRLMELVAEHGTSFAFPQKVVYPRPADAESPVERGRSSGDGAAADARPEGADGRTEHSNGGLGT